MTTPLRRAAWLLLPLAAAGCDTLDPHAREGAWRPAATNERNLATMVAVPGELWRGTDEPGAEGNTAAMAIERLRTDRVRELPETGIVRIGAEGGS